MGMIKKHSTGTSLNGMCPMWLTWLHYLKMRKNSIKMFQVGIQERSLTCRVCFGLVKFSTMIYLVGIPGMSIIFFDYFMMLKNSTVIFLVGISVVSPSWRKCLKELKNLTKISVVGHQHLQVM